MNIDLHCHSHFSDGKHSVEFLIERARHNNIDYLAITDHDCVDAYANSSANGDGLSLVCGVEISCTWESREIHVLGLCIDPEQTILQALLSNQLEQRRERMQAMELRLNKLGHQGLWHYLEALPCAAYTRSHVADFLVEQHICKSRQKAFKTHLGKSGRIYVPASWHTMTDAIQAITAAGGIAVLAHPGRYALTWRKLDALLADFAACGGDGMEVSYGNIQPDVKKRLETLAATHQLYCSAGSDFHDANATWTDIGRFPALSAEAKKNAIWTHPKWHSLNQHLTRNSLL